MTWKDKWFKRLIVINFLLVFVVILAGSIVRVTESGMGCPDWPKCFGALIPPVSENQVTWHQGDSYFEGQMIIHEKKLFTATKDIDSATQFNLSNWEEYTKHDYAIYNPLHTWVEFINRLATVALGFPVMAMFFLSFFYWKEKKLNILLAFTVVFLVGFQAFLGKLVVDSNLQGQTITIHMIGVFAILGVLIVLYNRMLKQQISKVIHSPLFKSLFISSLILTLVMVILGTQVREQIDEIAKSDVLRSEWINHVDYLFIIHRSLIWLVVGLNIYLMYESYKNNWYKNRWISIALVILAQAGLGILFSHFGFPKVAQPLHLVLSAVLFAIQFDLLVKLFKSP
jgi:cytochrome c oxidase assembly protein subunit 15